MRAVLLALLFPVLALAAPATVIRAVELKAAPATDAATLAALAEQAQVEMLERKGGWTRVRTAAGVEGWVRMLALRYAAIRALVALPKEDAKGAWTKRLHEGLAARGAPERSAALVAVVELRRRESIQALIERLGVEEDTALQKALVEALRAMTGEDHGSSAARCEDSSSDAARVSCDSAAVGDPATES